MIVMDGIRPDFYYELSPHICKLCLRGECQLTHQMFLEGYLFHSCGHWTMARNFCTQCGKGLIRKENRIMKDIQWEPVRNMSESPDSLCPECPANVKATADKKCPRCGSSNLLSLKLKVED